jgi:hypothetical protein
MEKPYETSANSARELSVRLGRYITETDSR